MFFYFASFILLLGPLVFVHELGHFLFAKLFNVRVDAFSMGFGPRLIAKKWGETEYCLSLIPLGGYVKLYGQDPSEAVNPELKNRSLVNLEPWKRFLVFVGGPLFNFLFAIMVFALMMLIGESHFAPVINRVIPGSVAEKVGFKTGDVVIAVNRAVVTKFEDVAKAINDSPHQPLAFRIKRSGQVKELSVTPEPTEGYSPYGEVIEVGDIQGLSGLGRHPVVGVANAQSIAAKAGLKSGDEIVELNQQPVKSWEALETMMTGLIAAAPKKATFTIKVAPRTVNYWLNDVKTGHKIESVKELVLPLKSLSELGLTSSEMIVASVMKNSPAQLAELQEGDRIVAIDGVPLYSFQDLKVKVQKAGETVGSFNLKFEHNGKIIEKKITPNANTARDVIGKEVKQYLMGVYPLYVPSEPEMIIERVFNPLTLTIESWSRALEMSAKSLISIKKLFFREVSIGTLGGPILIGKLAGDSMARGVSSFLRVMALISISLAIFNILPVPVLDGGHITLLLVEVIRGKPITMKQTEMVQQVGLSLIVLLLVVVLFNDITRVGIPAIKSFFQ